MGEVYRAHDERLRRDVAIKLLPPGSLEHEGSAARLRREALTLSQLNHPHIASIYDVGSDAGRDYLVLELVPGGTLFERIHAGALPIAEVLRIGIEIAEGLAAAHEQGIVHRDLKPGNVALDPRGHAKLLDFGLARHLPGVTRGATVTVATLGLGIAGTLPYMSPEQLRGAEIDSRTDLYALGVVLFEMSTGRRPFDGQVETAIVESILHDRAPQARSFNPAVPAVLETVIDRLLTKRAEDRYQSATEVIADLRHVLEDPQRARVRGRRGWIRFAPGIAAAAVLVVVASLILLRVQLPGGSSPGVMTVVVFPLEVLGQAEGAEYAGRAFAEAVSVNLAQAGGVEVLPVPVVSNVSRGGSAELARLATKLGAERAVTGTVLRSGDSLRATVSVMDPRRNRILWGKHYSMNQSDFGGPATELARELVTTLGLRTRRMHEYFRYESGTPEMADWQDFPQLLSALRGHRVEEGLRLTDSLLVRFPRSPEAHVMRLVALVDHDNSGLPGAREKLVAGLDALERLDPEDPNVVIHRASIWTFGDRTPERSIHALTEVLKRDDLRPGLRSHALRYRAAAEWPREDRKAAIKDMEEAIALDPGNPYNYVFLAGFLEESGNLDQALQRSRQAAAIDPAFRGPFLADMLFRSGRHEEALEVMREAVKTDPSGLDWAAYASFLARAGNAKEAGAAALEAERCPESGQARYVIATAWGYIQSADRAVANLERAAALGFDISSAAEDSAFVGIRSDPRFVRLVLGGSRGAKTRR
jgi:tetratricopeptide (TPR) repeat protein/TolB-like protein